MTTDPSQAALQKALRQKTSVVHLASGDLWAGAEVQVFNLACAQNRRPDMNVSVVLLNHGELENRLRAAGVPAIVLDESALSPRRLVGQLRTHLRRQKPNILHTHRYKENVLGSIAALGLGGIHSLRTVHGAPEHSFKWWNFKQQLPQWLDNITGRYLQECIVCVSPLLKQWHMDFMPDHKLAVIDNGIDVDAVIQRATGETASLPTGVNSKEVFKVGFFGRLVPVKRVDLIVEIAAALHHRHAGGFEFYIFGDGPLQTQIAGQVRAGRLDSGVHMMGFVSESAPYMKQMDAMLITSNHEGLPMIVLEALSLQLPVVSHAVGAIPAVLGNGRYGTLISGQGVDDYVLALEGLRGEPARARRQALAGLAHVRERYDVQHTSAQYVDLYRRLVCS